ncbi:MAG: GH3 auxin-responsive promoter family protein [Muribaculum sp.]|nr:GH3 auxin-responsive promoter family protein [Muribaculum sp.]
MLTSAARLILSRNQRSLMRWSGRESQAQIRLLRLMLRRAQHTSFGRAHGFANLLRLCSDSQLPRAYADAVEALDYESFRADVMKMIRGEKDVLWPGVCRNFAQSSGTSGGRSKFIPVTDDSLRLNHYAGAAASVASYLVENPHSRIFSGKGFILGGSFDSSLKISDPKVRIGDLSATLIDKINPLAALFRIPSKRVALLSDWNLKLPALANAAAHANVTNISGVPSWFMKVIQKVIRQSRASDIRDVWPNLEVFFHGGISFEPYRQEYEILCGPECPDWKANPRGMHYFETYNSSEGFFAVQYGPGPGPRPLRLLPDSGIYYEFKDLISGQIVTIDRVVRGNIYEMVISGCNGLWRYRLGDTVKIVDTAPLLITIAGRTKTFINAFGEELMENNAEAAIATACAATKASVADYTAAPVYSHNGKRGRHQWLIEWINPPVSTDDFARILDSELRKLNSDYDAKRSHTIFLDPPEVITLPRGTFEHWLASAGSGKLGGQRKIPRLCNDRHIADALLGILKNKK